MADYDYDVEITYSEADDGYIARVPELGCSAYGASVEAATHEVRHSIAAHLQALRNLGWRYPSREDRS